MNASRQRLGRKPESWFLVEVALGGPSLREIYSKARIENLVGSAKFVDEMHVFHPREQE